MIEKIIDRRNLYFAWEKLKKALVPGDIWFDEIELSRFEANLENEFNSIVNDITSGKYQTAPLVPVGYPKAKKEKKPQTRQSFYVSLRDQLTWVAIVNIVGPDLDHRMPFWSFGNRLFRSVWFEEKKDKKELKIGWYRHANGFIYRKWAQSWPRYRRAISLTSKIMANFKHFKDEPQKFKTLLISDNQELIEFELNSELPEEVKNKYWLRDYWKKELSGKVFWASIDLEKFYPNIKVESVIYNFRTYYSKEKQSEPLLHLITNLLHFSIDFSGWTDQELAEINLENKPGVYSHIPTGLLVAGFLANLALLEIDFAVSQKLTENGNISHFRFVDDHVILSDNFEDLVRWIEDYRKLLDSKQVGAKLNISKTEPPSLKEYLINKDSGGEETETNKRKAEEDTSLDPAYPSPLMTQTLVKVSNINKTEFDLLDDQEEDNLISDLQHLLLSNFPDHELRKDTRVSFAATMLSRLVPKKIEEMYDIYSATNELFRLRQKKEKLERKLTENPVSTQVQKFNAELDSLSKLIARNESFIKKEKERIKESQSNLRNTIYRLLKKAVVENHQKVRLWSRLIEYNLQTGYQGSYDILRSVDELENKECSPLSSEFIYALILNVFANKFIEAVNSAISDDNALAKKETLSRFLESCLDKRFNDQIQELATAPNKFYLKKSISLYKFALGSGIYMLSNKQFIIKNPQNFTSLIEEYQLVNWSKDNITEWAGTQGEQLENLVWWLLKRTSNLWDGKPNMFWGMAIRQLDLSSNVSWAIISQHPSYIPEDIKNSMASYPNHTKKYLTAEGWMNALNSKIDQIDVETPTLVDWVNWMRIRTTNLNATERMFFDPKLSEWTALNIVNKILEVIDTPEDPFYWFFGENGNLSKVHPANYQIPAVWLNEDNLDWKKWKTQLLTSEIKIKENAIFDFRFTPTDSIFQNSEQNIVFGLANLLLGLLCKSFEMPYIWNVFGQQQSYLFLAAKKLEKIPVSSYTFGIIESCFSLRNIDTKFVKSYQEDLKMEQDFSDDSISEVPNVESFATLRFHLGKSISILEKYQINVQDNLPRQLIPINLLQNSRKNNLLSEENKESQVDQ